MSWAETKWGSDRTMEGVLDNLLGGNRYGPTDEVQQTLTVTTSAIAGNSSRTTTVIGSFTAPYTATLRVNASLKCSSTTKPAWMAVSTTSTATAMATLQESGTVLGSVSVTATDYTTAAIDVAVVSGTTYYLHLACDTTSSSYNARCQSAMVCYSATWLPGSVVKSVQRGVVAPVVPTLTDSIFAQLYQKITINAVNMKKAWVQFSCFGSDSVSTTRYITNVAVLNSATELYLYSPYSSNQKFGGAWQVIEFY